MQEQQRSGERAAEKKAKSNTGGQRSLGPNQMWSDLIDRKDTSDGGESKAEYCFESFKGMEEVKRLGFILGVVIWTWYDGLRY